jgi:hypothetical protein
LPAVTSCFTSLVPVLTLLTRTPFEPSEASKLLKRGLILALHQVPEAFAQPARGVVGVVLERVEQVDREVEDTRCPWMRSSFERSFSERLSEDQRLAVDDVPPLRALDGEAELLASGNTSWSGAVGRRISSNLPFSPMNGPSPK